MTEILDKFNICAIVGVVGSGIAHALGGWDAAIQTLLVFMAIDFVMGIVVSAVFKKSKKTDSGALNSGVCWKGIVKKICTLLLVVCGTYADRLVGSDYIRNTLVIAFCTAELISIVELAGLMGIMPEPVQKVLDKVIDVLNSKKGDSNDN